jgi:hypothetical protein
MTTMQAGASRWRWRGAAIVAALVVLLPVVAPASAHHAGRPIGSFSTCTRPVSPPRCSSVGNDANHFVAFDATLTIGLAESLAATMVEDYEPTKLTMTLQPSIDAHTDVIAFSEDYGNNGAAGWVYCPPEAPQGINRQHHRWCQAQELYFNLNPSMAAFFADDPSRDYVTCHELGHTLGIRHWGNPPESAGPAAATCMNADTPDGPTDLHQVDHDHINLYNYSRLPFRANQVPLDLPGRRNVLLLGRTGWADTLVQATELERYDSLAAMTRGADAVVVGRIVDIAAGRSFGGATGHPLHYAAVTVAVEEVAAGALPGRHGATFTLEVPLFAGAESLDALRASLPPDESLFFVRNKGGADSDFYRLVIQRAAIVNRDGAAEVAPGDDDFLDALGGASFEEVLEAVRRAAG